MKCNCAISTIFILFMLSFLLMYMMLLAVNLNTLYEKSPEKHKLIFILTFAISVLICCTFLFIIFYWRPSFYYWKYSVTSLALIILLIFSFLSLILFIQDEVSKDFAKSKVMNIITLTYTILLFTGGTILFFIE